MNAGNGDTPPTRSPRPCPICGKPAVARYRPFCSKRCADVDLGRWFGEAYRIPADEEDAKPQPQGGRDKDEED
jgi:uncharacterized protein